MRQSSVVPTYPSNYNDLLQREWVPICNLENGRWSSKYAIDKSGENVIIYRFTNGFQSIIGEMLIPSKNREKIKVY